MSEQWKGTTTAPTTRIDARIKIYKGDRVRIINPNIEQEPEGEAFGVTKDKLIEVRTKSDKVIRRIQKIWKG